MSPYTAKFFRSGPGMPVLQAAGRFLAPAGRYFPDLLDAPVTEANLVSAAVAEIGRGARWVKVIADFPDLAAGTDAEATYRIEAIAQLVAAAHDAGARVAVHATLPDAGQLVAAGVDSIEHGFGLDERALHDMADRGTAWTPTVAALLALLDAPDLTPGRRRRLREGRARVAELLPVAARLGVPVLAGTDVTGSIPREVALLAQMGLEPKAALATASTWPRQSSARRPPPASSPTITTPARTPASWPIRQLWWPAEPGCGEPQARPVRQDQPRQSPRDGCRTGAWRPGPTMLELRSGGSRAGRR